MNIKYQKSHTTQNDQSDCGVICLKTILNHYKSNYSIEKLRELSGTTKSGTTMLGLLQCANKIGLDTKAFEADIDSLIKNKNITILHVIIDEVLSHYIVCFGFDVKKQKFIISNPSHAKIEYLTKDELSKIWVSKALLLVKPTKNLLKSKEVKKTKFLWLLKYIKQDLNLLITSLILGVFISILSLATAVYSQKLIDDLLPTSNNFKITASIFLLLFLFVLNTFLSYLRGVFLIRQSKLFNIRIIDYFYSSILKLKKTFFDNRKIGDFIARMNDTSRIQNTISTIFSNIMIDVLMIVITSIAIFSYNTRLGIISLCWLPIYSVLVVYFNPKIKKRQQLVMQNYAKNESNYIDTINGIELIKSSNREYYFSSFTKSIYTNFQNSIFNLSNLGLNYSIISQLISNIFIVFILSYSIYLVTSDILTSGVIVAILQLIGMLMRSSSNLAMANIEIQEAKIAFNRMFEFASTEKEQQGEIVVTNFNGLEIKNLSFRFAGRSELLKKINLSIQKGEFVALVGESGSGKSTLGQIVQKFYPYENGKIIVNNNHNLQQVELTSWRNLVGVIPQDIHIFSGNVLDNILLGAEDSPENVIKFCQENGFEPFIAQLPQGYATLLGEEGINLSGGQKQIIALARILYKKPQFLILDEATAAMDRNTEKFTLEILKKQKKNIGVLFISHRLHTLKKYADRIYVLEKGTITAKGSHLELMQKTNFYSDFWRELN